MILLATRIYHPKTNWKETLPWISSLDIETVTSWGKVRLMVQKSGNHHFIWQIYVNIPEFTGFYTSQVVQGFFHQQYDWICKNMYRKPPNLRRYASPGKGKWSSIHRRHEICNHEKHSKSARAQRPVQGTDRQMDKRKKNKNRTYG